MRTLTLAEPIVNELIKASLKELKEMRPTDGLSTPRDIELVKRINKVARFINELQNAMKVINPDYETWE